MNALLLIAAWIVAALRPNPEEAHAMNVDARSFGVGLVVGGIVAAVATAIAVAAGAPAMFPPLVGALAGVTVGYVTIAWAVTQ